MIVPPRHQETGVLREVWRTYNVLRDYVSSLRPQPGRNVRIKHTTEGVILSAEISDPGTEMRIMKVREIRDNYLDCTDWSADESTEDRIKVARPYLQRRYVYEADADLTITYVSAQEVTATDGSTTETWKVTRLYRDGDMIVAARIRTKSSTESWDWLDLNMDGRDWAKVEE